MKKYRYLEVSMLNRHIKITFFCGCLLTLFLCLFGCGKESESMKVYYKNTINNELAAVDFQPESTEVQKIMEEMLAQMRKKPKQNDMDVLLPDFIKIISCETSMNVANIYFGKEYNDLNNIDEVLLRAGVVKAVTQIEGIDFVRFYVDESPAQYADGTYIGLMSPEDFINDSKDSISNVEWRDITLYFANKRGDMLIKTKENVAYAKNTSIERIIVEQLIKGTSDANLSSTLPSDLKLLSISVNEGICYVNLSSAFLTEMVNVSNEIPIYSIVNSLCELPTIRGVKIMINGDSTKSYRESIRLDTQFNFNKELVSS